MKRLQRTIFLVCIATSIHLYVHQTDTKVDENNYSTIQESTKNITGDTVISFFAQDDDNDTDNPSGRYWPAERTFMNGKLINSAFTDIGNTAYSQVVEEKALLPDQELHYLGHFMHPESEEIIYLYGTKDKKAPHDANEETIIDDNGDDDEASDDDNDQDNN